VFFFSGFSIAMGQQVSDLPTLFCQQGSNGEREKKGIAEDGVVSQSCHGKHSLHWSLMPSLCSCIFMCASPGELMPLHRILNSTIQQIKEIKGE